MKRVTASEAGLAEAAQVLRSGGLVLFPTESFYGAAVDPWNLAALERLVQSKGRTAKSPLPLILPDGEALARVVAAVPFAARALMDRHWPGSLTLVLPAQPTLAAALVGEHGVGVRVSPHRVARALAQAFGGPITATSANPSGAPPPTNATAAAQSLPDADLLLDGGDTPGGPPSTVVAVASGGRLTLIRKGAVDVEIE